MCSCSNHYVTVTQYILPDGRKVRRDVPIPERIKADAKAIQDAGYVFEAEILVTGQVSLTIADPVKEEDVAINVCRNDPDTVQHNFHLQITKFAEKLRAKTATI